MISKEICEELCDLEKFLLTVDLPETMKINWEEFDRLKLECRERVGYLVADYLKPCPATTSGELHGSENDLSG